MNCEVLAAMAAMPRALPLPRPLVLGCCGCGCGGSMLEADLVSTAEEERKIIALAAAVGCVLDRCEYTA